jgi:hypothetical protein
VLFQLPTTLPSKIDCSRSARTSAVSLCPSSGLDTKLLVTDAASAGGCHPVTTKEIRSHQLCTQSWESQGK